MDCLTHLTTFLAPASVQAIPSSVDLLCLGSGWTYSFLGSSAADAGLTTAFTSRSAKSGGIVFDFDPESDDVEPFRALPDARTIVIIFPLYTRAAARRLVKGYLDSRQAGDPTRSTSPCEKEETPHFILLGSTGIWDSGPTVRFAPLSDRSCWAEDEKSAFVGQSDSVKQSYWRDRHSPVSSVPRAIAENELLSLNKEDNPVRRTGIPTSVLCLSGLWGHGRSPRRYISVIAPTKEKLKGLGSVHLVHGRDVARAIVAMTLQRSKAEGQRWLLTNERVYDLWDLCSRWGDAGEAGRDHAPQGPQPGWVQELIAESRRASKDASLGVDTLQLPQSAIRSLPRTVEQMGKALDGTDFWDTFGLAPDVPWVD